MMQRRRRQNIAFSPLKAAEEQSGEISPNCRPSAPPTWSLQSLESSVEIEKCTIGLANSFPLLWDQLPRSRHVSPDSEDIFPQSLSIGLAVRSVVISAQKESETDRNIGTKRWKSRRVHSLSDIVIPLRELKTVQLN